MARRGGRQACRRALSRLQHRHRHRGLRRGRGLPGGLRGGSLALPHLRAAVQPHAAPLRHRPRERRRRGARGHRPAHLRSAHPRTGLLRGQRGRLRYHRGAGRAPVGLPRGHRARRSRLGRGGAARRLAPAEAMAGRRPLPRAARRSGCGSGCGRHRQGVDRRCTGGSHGGLRAFGRHREPRGQCGRERRQAERPAPPSRRSSSGPCPSRAARP